VSQIVDAIRARRPDLDVRVGWVELVDPALRDVLRTIDVTRRTVLVPMLLSSGYHDRVDLPAAIADARPGTAHAAVLGPDPLLAVALADRLAEAGRRPGDPVVLAAAGSSDPDAVASVHTQAELLAAELTRRDRPAPAREPAGPAAPAGVPAPASPPATAAGGSVGAGVRVTVGFGSSAGPTVVEAVAAARAGGGRVVLAPYLLAPGFFADRLTEAGADLVAAPLGAHPAVVDLVLRRAASTEG
jgi:sirohydrochlorin ferrochelatase